MATYMCGCLRDHITPEEIRQQAFQAGREKQGKLNAETVREIHDLVYAEAFNRAIDKCVEIAKDETCVKECKSGFNCVECMVERMEKLKEQK